jgi:hypothetical protein
VDLFASSPVPKAVMERRGRSAPFVVEEYTPMRRQHWMSWQWRMERTRLRWRWPPSPSSISSIAHRTLVRWCNNSVSFFNQLDWLSNHVSQPHEWTTTREESFHHYRHICNSMLPWWRLHL